MHDQGPPAPGRTRCPAPARHGPIALLLALVVTTPPAEPADDATLLARLRAGGLVIALVAAESAAPEPGMAPTIPGCNPGTRLTQGGWQRAVATGVGLRKQRVFVELAHAGPGCAARHTAYLVFGADRVRHDAGLAASCSALPPERAARANRLAQRLGTPPPYPRTNLAVVVDACNMHDIEAPGWPGCATDPRPGDALLFDPVHPGPPTPLGCLDSAQIEVWSRIVEFPAESTLRN